MGGLRRFAAGVAEVKRTYVRPDQRGRRLGATVPAKLLDDARSLGCEQVRLGSGKFMTAAHRTYEAAGFVLDALGAPDDVVREVEGEEVGLLGIHGSTVSSGGSSGRIDRIPPARGDPPATS